MPKLTSDDLEHLSQALARRIEDNQRDEADEDYDEGGPEVVVTSIGYVDLWLDGEVTAGGTLLAKLDT